jgi:hypothetical protein
VLFARTPPTVAEALMLNVFCVREEFTEELPKFIEIVLIVALPKELLPKIEICVEFTVALAAVFPIRITVVLATVLVLTVVLVEVTKPPVLETTELTEELPILIAPVAVYEE